MKAGMRTPAFIRLWKRSTTWSPSINTIATSVARSPMVGERPVVSKSMTAVRGKAAIVVEARPLPSRLCLLPRAFDQPAAQRHPIGRGAAGQHRVGRGLDALGQHHRVVGDGHARA